MYGLGISMKLSPASIQTMDEFAKTFSEKVQRRVFKRAGIKAAEAMVEQVKKHVPVSAKTARFVGPTRREMRTGRRHTRDSVAYRVKSYPANGRVLFIVGYRSGENNLATLMEKGNFLTTPDGRMTKHETTYVKKHAGFRTEMVPKQRRDGSFRSVREQVRRRDNKRSIGSFATGGKGLNRGNFPKSGQPYAPITTAAREMRNTIIEIMETEIASGFSRAFAREAGNH